MHTSNSKKKPNGNSVVTAAVCSMHAVQNFAANFIGKQGKMMAILSVFRGYWINAIDAKLISRFHSIDCLHNPCKNPIFIFKCKRLISEHLNILNARWWSLWKWALVQNNINNNKTNISYCDNAKNAPNSCIWITVTSVCILLCKSAPLLKTILTYPYWPMPLLCVHSVLWMG